MKHKNVCNLNIINLRADKFNNLVFDFFVALNGECLFSLESFIYPTGSQLDCSKRMLKFTLQFWRELLLYVTGFLQP
jgi:hypothetical protein